MHEKIPYSLNDVFPDTNLPGKVYLFVSNHYILYKNKDDQIEGERYEKFQMKNMKFIFIDEDEYDEFDAWTIKIKGKDESDVYQHFLDNEVGDKAKLAIDLKENMATYFAFDLDDEQLDNLESQTRELVTAAKENSNLEKALISMENHRRSIVDHSLNVANLTVFLCLNMGYNQITMLETAYLGGLLHDYGKTKINNEILDLSPTSAKYLSAMEKHPILGSTSFMLNSDFSNEVQRIIIEHHERYDGTGFPHRLKGKKIYPLTTIVGMANYFDNLLALDTGHIKERRRRAVRRLELEANRSFEPQMTFKAVGHLRRIFG